MNATRCIGGQNKIYINNNDDNLIQQLPRQSTSCRGEELLFVPVFVVDTD